MVLSVFNYITKSIKIYRFLLELCFCWYTRNLPCSFFYSDVSDFVLFRIYSNFMIMMIVLGSSLWADSQINKIASHVKQNLSYRESKVHTSHHSYVPRISLSNLKAKKIGKHLYHRVCLNKGLSVKLSESHVVLILCSSIIDIVNWEPRTII